MEELEIAQLRPQSDNITESGLRLDFMAYINRLSKKIDADDVLAKLKLLKSDLERAKNFR